MPAPAAPARLSEHRVHAGWRGAPAADGKMESGRPFYFRYVGTSDLGKGGQADHFILGMSAIGIWKLLLFAFLHNVCYQKSTG